METLESKIIVNRQKILRHKLQKHVKLQKFSTANTPTFSCMLRLAS